MEGWGDWGLGDLGVVASLGYRSRMPYTPRLRLFSTAIPRHPRTLALMPWAMGFSHLIVEQRSALRDEDIGTTCTHRCRN